MAAVGTADLALVAVVRGSWAGMTLAVHGRMLDGPTSSGAVLDLA